MVSWKYPNEKLNLKGIIWNYIFFRLELYFHNWLWQIEIQSTVTEIL